MDDGAKDADTSLGMLSALASQGVKTVYATPHFYADSDSVESFLERRGECYGELMRAIGDRTDLPEVRLGAEIMICKQLVNLDLSPLLLDGTSIMLLEYPVSKFEDWFTVYTERISASYSATPMMAHFDRYEWINAKNARLFNNGRSKTYFQMNCEGLADKKMLKLLFDLYESGVRCVFGTDCHNLTSRKPDFDKLTELFQKDKIKLGPLGLTSAPTAYIANALAHSEKKVLSASSFNGLI
jgi:protein-tyrosine phosphatase